MWGYQTAKAVWAAKYCLTSKGWVQSVWTVCEHYKISSEELYIKIKEYNGYIYHEAYPIILFNDENDIKLFIKDYLTSLDIIKRLGD